MQIYVKNIQGKTFCFTVHPSDKVDQLKLQMAEQEGTAVDRREFQFIFKRKFLEDGCLLSDYRIKDGSTLASILLDNYPIKFFVITSAGPLVLRTFSITIRPKDTIEKVMLQIRDQEGIPLSQQRLTYNNKPLSPSHTLRGYNIRDGVTLHLLS